MAMRDATQRVARETTASCFGAPELSESGATGAEQRQLQCKQATRAEKRARRAEEWAAMIGAAAADPQSSKTDFHDDSEFRIFAEIR